MGKKHDFYNFVFFYLSDFCHLKSNMQFIVWEKKTSMVISVFGQGNE